jgi:hypothetical protein
VTLFTTRFVGNGLHRGLDMSWLSGRTCGPACSTISSERMIASSIHAPAFPKAPPPSRVSSTVSDRIEFLGCLIDDLL